MNTYVVRMCVRGYWKNLRDKVYGKSLFELECQINWILVCWTVIWTNTNDRFDASFVNPIIFYRSVEFVSSARTGNALLGFLYKYKWSNQFLWTISSRWVFSGDIKSGDNSWKNKYGYQLGVNYNAFMLIIYCCEYNQCASMYSHSVPITNYGHNNQSIGISGVEISGIYCDCPLSKEDILPMWK
jgi:hypothetical protein